MVSVVETDRARCPVAGDVTSDGGGSLMSFRDHGRDLVVVAVQLWHSVARPCLLHARRAPIGRPVEQLLFVRDLPAVLPGRQQRQVVAVLRVDHDTSL